MNSFKIYPPPLSLKRVAKLIFVLFIFMICSCQDYQENTPTTAFVENDIHFVDVMRDSLAYSSAVQGPFNSSRVRSNLNLGRPVILGGGGSNRTSTGHMWVTDGYVRGVYCSGQTLLKLHMNLGWNGDDNGFFNFDNFSVTIDGITRSYNNDKYMIYNITP
ncbi:C10 family peptidase [Algoriphagus namhaensis]